MNRSSAPAIIALETCFWVKDRHRPSVWAWITRHNWNAQLSVTSTTCCFCESVCDHVSKVMQSHVLAWTISHIENLAVDSHSWQRANIWPIYLVSSGSTQVRLWTLLCSESINVLCVHKLIYYGGTAHWASWPSSLLSVSWPLSNTRITYCTLSRITNTSLSSEALTGPVRSQEVFRFT